MDILESINFRKYRTSAIVGDLNIDYLKSPSLIEEIALRFESISYTKIPTRITDKIESAIDHAIIRDLNANTKIIKTDLSDHFTVLIILRLKTKPKDIPSQKLIRVINSYNIESMLFIL